MNWTCHQECRISFCIYAFKTKEYGDTGRNFGLNEDIYKFLHEKEPTPKITELPTFHRILAGEKFLQRRYPQM